MTTLSVPVSSKLEELVNSLVKKGYGANKADVVRKALELLAEEEAIKAVRDAQQEVKDGKTLKGDLGKLIKKMP
jgi:Arc/MetJ-type ribon-helix-helix transcriptional regulator